MHGTLRRHLDGMIGHIEEFLKKYSAKIFREVSPKEQAKEILKKLKEAGHTIIIITAREEKHVEELYLITHNWLKQHEIPFDKLIINSVDKAEKCKENHIDIFIDDSIKYCESVWKQMKTPVYLFDSVYNQMHENENIKRVFSWEEIYEEINKLKET